MQHDRLKSPPRVLRVVVSGTCGRTSLRLPGIKAKQTGQTGHAAACLPTHGDTDDFVLTVLTGDTMAIHSVNGILIGGKPVYKDTRTWEYS